MNCLNLTIFLYWINCFKYVPLVYYKIVDYQDTSPLETKWLIRVILKDLKIKNLDLLKTLKYIHPFFLDIYYLRNTLKDACETINNLLQDCTFIYLFYLNL